MTTVSSPVDTQAESLAVTRRLVTLIGAVRHVRALRNPGVEALFDAATESFQDTLLARAQEIAAAANASELTVEHLDAAILALGAESGDLGELALAAQAPQPLEARTPQHVVRSWMDEYAETRPGIEAAYRQLCDDAGLPL